MCIKNIVADTSVHLNRTGRLQKAPKNAALRQTYRENQELSRMINEDNENTFAGIARNAGGKLAVLQAPISATADEKQQQKMKKKKMASTVWGASSHS